MKKVIKKGKIVVCYKQGDIVPKGALFLGSKKVLEGSHTAGLHDNSGRIIITKSYITMNLYEIDIDSEIEYEPNNPYRPHLKNNEL